MGRDGIRNELFRGAMTYLVLAVLRDGEGYGYQVVQRIAERSGGAFVPSEGSLYPALHRLEADGAVEAAWRDGERGPRRRWYRITAGGSARLAAMEAEWQTFTGAVTGIARPLGEGTGA
jgi:PadR family transcriptional regulator, regulatory protein PadR